MQSIRALSTLSDTIASLKINSSSIGFVPTMGALHAGHLKLIEKSIDENDVTIVSIFVNPLQFNNKEDLDKYPRVLEEDLNRLQSLSVDYLFIPDEGEFYNSKPVVSINFGPLSERLEGKYRNGHFEGVGVVVSKFLNLISPDRAYFGLKDLQQFILIRKMCHDLNFQCEIIGVETVREESGLALSSRNRRLSAEGLETANILFRVLDGIKSNILNGKSISESKESAFRICNEADNFELEYLEVINPEDLESAIEYNALDELAICIAGYVEGVRLIDNLYLRLK